MIKELAESQAVLAEQLKVVEEAEEWQEYKAEVAFELDVLRSRYTQSGEPMTPQRTAQFQAHHRKLQMAIMDRAADKAAQKLFLSMTSKERAKMRREFGELEAAGHTLEVEDVMALQPFQTSELDESLSNLRLSLLQRAQSEGQVSREHFEQRMAHERALVQASRERDPERRQLHEEAVASLGADPFAMPGVAASASDAVKEKASIEDRLLQMRDRVRRKEAETLSAQVERERSLDDAGRVLDRHSPGTDSDVDEPERT